MFWNTWKLENSKTLKALKMILGTCWTTFVFMSMLKSHSLTFTLSHSHTLTLSHTHSHTLTLSHSHTLSFSHSLSLDMLNNFCFHVYAQNSLSHFHTLALSLSHTPSFSHSITLDMLNKFCFHLYAQKSLFIVENCTLTLSCYFRCHRAGFQPLSDFQTFFSWEPALWTLNSQERVRLLW